jgi:cytochrome P450
MGLVERLVSGGLRRLYPDPPIIEEVGAGRLVPAHPAPLAQPPGAIKLAILARRSLLSTWTRDCYAAEDYAFRLLRRQVCVLNAPDSVKAALVTHSAIFERKGAMMRRALEPLLGDGLFISDGETWQRRRPLVADIVHKLHLPLFGPAMTDGAENLLARWTAHSHGEELDLLDAMAALTAGIIARAVFGAQLAPAALAEIVGGFACYQERVDSFNLPFFLGDPNGRSLFGNRRLLSAADRVRRVVDEVIAAHLRGEGDASSIIAMLLRHMGTATPTSPDLEGLRNEAATIFMAGHETTATTLTWALYLLAKAPWVAADLRDEVDSVLGGRPATLDDLVRLPLTRAVLEETLRLYPPVPILPRQAREKLRIGDLEIEQDALVLVCPWLLHRSPDLWQDPTAFRPQRFLYGRPTPYTYIPFSLGPRICAGLNFGLAEAIICLATIVGGARVELRPGFRATPVSRLSLRPRDPIMVQVQRR